VSRHGSGGQTPCLRWNVNRLCGLRVQAIVNLAGLQSLDVGDAILPLAGGAESYESRALYPARSPWGQRWGDVASFGHAAGHADCPFGPAHLGITAEKSRGEHDVTHVRSQDAFALLSQECAAAAIWLRCYLQKQIVPVEVKRGRDIGGGLRDRAPQGHYTRKVGRAAGCFSKGRLRLNGGASIGHNARGGRRWCLHALRRAIRRAASRLTHHSLCPRGGSVRNEGIGAPVPRCHQMFEKGTGLTATDF